MTKVIIYTDGACATNPGRGGWAYVTICNCVQTEASGTVAWTTNNQMELQAAIKALSALDQPSEVEVITDSQYVATGMTEWISDWKAFDWQTARGRSVKNRSQWEELDRLCQKHSVTWQWIRGHAGDPHNERCDFLANQQAGIREGEEPWWRRRRTQRARR